MRSHSDLRGLGQGPRGRQTYSGSSLCLFLGFRTNRLLYLFHPFPVLPFPRNLPNTPILAIATLDLSNQLSSLKPRHSKITFRISEMLQMDWGRFQYPPRT